jgi:hypothetical protein
MPAANGTRELVSAAGDLGAARARARDLFSVDAMVEGTLAAYEEAASHLEPTP